MANETTSVSVIPAEALLEHWQGHRRLTRKTIEAFPEDKLFTYTVGGMRTFGEMVCELLGMAVPSVEGVATGKWQEFAHAKPTTKMGVLEMWDVQTGQINEAFARIPLARFSAVEKAFGQWEMSGIGLLLYVIDNEIHHRAQGFVYLRTLGIEPPPFWERS